MGHPRRAEMTLGAASLMVFKGAGFDFSYGFMRRAGFPQPYLQQNQGHISPFEPAAIYNIILLTF